MKKFGLSIVLASVLSVGASAFCFNNGCYTGGVGIGGVYSDLGGNDSANANAYGGYINAYGQSVYFGRLLAYGGFTFGSGAINKNGANLQTLGSRKVYFAWEGLLKVGFNIASKDKPLFINLQAGADTILNRSFERALFFVGAELDGRLPLNTNFAFNYSAGYGWIVVGNYTFNDIRSHLSGYNQRIHASLGFDVRISENYAFYLKAIGRYYGLQDSKSVVLDAANNTSISYPAANGYSVGLELGFKGI